MASTNRLDSAHEWARRNQGVSAAAWLLVLVIVIAPAWILAENRAACAAAELLKAQRDEAAGQTMSALAHATAALRAHPNAAAATLAWNLRVRSPRLLWTSPKDGNSSAPGHTGEVSSVAFSPDGARLASGSEDKTVRLWDAATGKELARLEGHTHYVLSVAYSPDGARLASGSLDKTVRLWDAATGKELARLEGHTGWVRSVAYSPDGAKLALCGMNGTVLLWDAATGARIEMAAEEASLLLAEWSGAAIGAAGPPTRLPGKGAVLLEGEAAWRMAWWAKERDKNGLPRKVLEILDRWERDLGLRVNLETGALERLPTPGSAYANDPKIAERCR